MRRSSAINFLILIAVVAAAIWAFGSVLSSRFSQGDVYPRYSTLRTDPLGAKALYEAMDQLPGVECQRNYRPLDKLTLKPATALMIYHVRPSDLSYGSALDGESVVKLATGGARVVITIDGQLSATDTISEAAKQKQRENDKKRIQELREKLEKEKAKEDEQKGRPAEPQEKKSDGTKRKNEWELDSLKSLKKQLGISVKAGAFTMLPKGGYKTTPARAMAVAAGDMPLWYSKTSLQIEPDASGKWEPLAVVKDDIVLAQRRIGRGVIILATDTYFVSNEALWKEPSPAFLDWLTGGASTIIFDETHLGTQQNPGIMTIANRYGLQGLFFGALALFGLFIWQNSFSLIPPREDNREGSAGTVSGQSATTGLVSLLRRGIPRSNLLRQSFEAWEKSASAKTAAMQRVLPEARKILNEGGGARKNSSGKIPALYRRLCDSLHPNRY